MNTRCRELKKYPRDCFKNSMKRFYYIFAKASFTYIIFTGFTEAFGWGMGVLMCLTICPCIFEGLDSCEDEEIRQKEREERQKRMCIHYEDV